MNFLLKREKVGHIIIYCTFLFLFAGEYVYSQVGPGDVSSNLQFWLKADANVTGSSSVTAWGDMSGMGNNATAQGDPQLMPLDFNFNPVIAFDGTGDFFNTPVNMNYATVPNVTVISVFRPNSDSSGGVWGEDDGNWDRFILDANNFSSTLNNIVSNGSGGNDNINNLYETNQVNVVSVIYEQGVTDGSRVFVNAVNERSFTSNQSGSSNPLQVGALGVNDFNFNGGIAEIMVYNRTLNQTELNKIETYLALKYGIALEQNTYYASDWDGTTGTVIWDTSDNAGFNNDIAGIGLDTSAFLDQRISKSQNVDGLLTLALDNNFTVPNTDTSIRSTGHAIDYSFMVWGNNDQSIDWGNNGATTFENKRLDRVWHIDETGSVGTVYISVPDNTSTEVTKLPTVTTSLFLVTKMGDADFTTGATVTEMTLNGVNWELPSGFDFVDGMYFTFETLRDTKTIINTDWSIASNWMPVGIPTADDNVIIPANLDVVIPPGTNAVGNKVTVEAGASLNINTGANLTTSYELSLESTSVSYSSLILDGTVTGTVNYLRHVNTGASAGTITNANDLISAPLTGQTFGQFRSANSNILSGNIGGNLAFLFGPYDSSGEAYVNYSPSDDTSTLDAVIGYRTGSTNNGTYIFTGTVENGVIARPLVTSSSDLVWNLIGNPYPSYLNVQAFLNNSNNQTVINNSDAFGMYGYDGVASDGWTIYNLANTTASTIITPGQGFFIATEPNVSGNIIFTPSMRTTGNADDFIIGRNTSSSELTFVRLKTSGTGKSYKTEFYFNDNASTGLDIGYDTKLWNSVVPNFALYSHLIDDNMGQPMAIQSFNDTNNITIPLGVHAYAGELLIFSIDESTLPSNIKVFLQDVEQNITTDLTLTDYSINPVDDLEGVGRFYLNITNTLSNNESVIDNLELYNNPRSKILVLKGVLSFDAKILIYDIQGRLFEEHVLKTNVDSQNIELNNLNSGVYITVISGNNLSKTQGVIFSRNTN